MARSNRTRRTAREMISSLEAPTEPYVAPPSSNRAVPGRSAGPRLEPCDQLGHQSAGDGGFRSTEALRRGVNTGTASGPHLVEHQAAYDRARREGRS